ncbi:MAG: hypothetical protein JWO62_3554 [Acidimicrobiaceae bacterium]|nr:hypothetical protein [Acidimicrobiaceae bacterium]
MLWSMVDWATISSLAGAGGTLVLAVATFASVRSANRAARAAERSLLAGLRPVLMPSRLEDPPEKISFVDAHWVKVNGGHAAFEVGEDAIYLVIALRNAGSGIAVLHGWSFHPDRLLGDTGHADPSDFRRLSRDIYVPAGDVGFWQGAFRDPTDPAFAAARDAADQRKMVTIDLLYGDHEGGQRMISRFTLMPASDSWLASVSRHWNLDRADPR